MGVLQGGKVSKKQRIKRLETRIEELERALHELRAIVEAQRAMRDVPYVPYPVPPRPADPDPLWQSVYYCDDNGTWTDEVRSIECW